MSIQTTHNLNKQKGTVLAVSLVILLVLTIIGVSSMSSSSLQEKMSGNFRDREIAFQAAETALAAAEQFAKDSINTQGAFNNSNGFYEQYQGPTANNALDATWWTGTNSGVLGDSKIPITIPEVASQPRYIIEYRGDIGEEEGTDINIEGYGESSGGGAISSFRITVRATGMSDNTQVILTSYYGKRL